MPDFLQPPYLLSILLALSVHEWAHGYVAYLLGDPTAKYEGRMTLNPIAHLDPIGTLMFLFVGFGWGKPVPINPRYFKSHRRDTALVSIAGPLSNLVLALLASLLFALVVPHTAIIGTVGTGNAVTNLVGEFLRISVILNLNLMAFNLLPIAPLDGSKVVAAFLPYDYLDSYDRFMRYGPYILLTLLIASRGGGFDPLSAWIGLIIGPFIYVLTVLHL